MLNITAIPRYPCWSWNFTPNYYNPATPVCRADNYRPSDDWMLRWRLIRPQVLCYCAAAAAAAGSRMIDDELQETDESY